MANESDSDLLRDFSLQGSETAFAELIRRHVPLVYSVAMRHVEDPAHAEEITQAVFIILARKAVSLRSGIVLEGWLYEATRLASLSFLRGERRRRFREQEAYMQSTLQGREDDWLWDRLAPLLDDAMSHLGARDRDIVILRYFKDKSVREVAAALQVSEAAAQRRILRAVEKLRKFFMKRGVSATSALIVAAIAARSVHAAPVAVAQSVAGIAATKGATAGISTSTLVKGALKLMAFSKAKATVVIVLGILLAAGTTTVTVQQIQAHKRYVWEVPRAEFGVLYKSPPGVAIVPTKFKQDGEWCCDGSRGAMGIAQPVEQIVYAAYQIDKLHTLIVGSLPAGKYDFFAKLVEPQNPHKNQPTDEKWATALQKEITRKFGVTGRLEKREVDVLVLKPRDGGPKGFTVSHSMPNGRAMDGQAGNMTYFEQPTSTLIWLLQREFQSPIVDETGLTEKYDYALTWDEPNRAQLNPEGLKQALHEQLGLDLVPGRESIQMLVVQKTK